MTWKKIHVPAWKIRTSSPLELDVLLGMSHSIICHFLLNLRFRDHFVQLFSLLLFRSYLEVCFRSFFFFFFSPPLLGKEDHCTMGVS